MRRYSQRLAFLQLLCFHFGSCATLAQEGCPSPADSTTGGVFRWLNFAIVVAMIVYVFGKSAPHFRAIRN